MFCTTFIWSLSILQQQVLIEPTCELFITPCFLSYLFKMRFIWKLSCVSPLLLSVMHAVKPILHCIWPYIGHSLYTLDCLQVVIIIIGIFIGRLPVCNHSFLTVSHFPQRGKWAAKWSESSASRCLLVMVNVKLKNPGIHDTSATLAHLLPV